MSRDPSIPIVAALLSLLCTMGGVCLPSPQDSTLSVPETVWEVTGSSAAIFVQLGTGVSDNYEFKIGYDSSSHGSDHNYLHQTSVTTGKSAGEKLTFTLSEGLEPNVRYYYSLAYREDPSKEWTWRNERSFMTPRSAGSSFRFCVVSDLHYDGSSLKQKNRVLLNVALDQPDFVVTLGDMVPASDQGHGKPPDCLAAYSRLGSGPEEAADIWYRAVATGLAGFAHSSMVIWVNGNHEGMAGYLFGCPQYQWVLQARKTYIPLLDQYEPNGFFGTVTWGDLQIIWLDPLAYSTFDPYWTNNPAGYRLAEAQSLFLSQTLSASTSRWKVICAHTLFGGIPNDPCSLGRAYARGNANYARTQGTDQNYIQSLMEEYGVNAYFYGHDHMYSISELNGVAYVVVGSGATGWWTDCLKEKYLPWSARTDLGHLRVDVTTDSLKLSYIKASLDSSNGQVLDTYYIYPR